LHHAFGVGVYHFFRDFDVVVERGIAAPAWLANSFQSPLSVYLTGRGQVLHVLNDRGVATQEGKQVEWSCVLGPDVPAGPIADSPPNAVPPGQPSATRNELEFLAALGPKPGPSSEGDGGGRSGAAPSPTTSLRSGTGDLATSEAEPQVVSIVPWWAYTIGVQTVVLVCVGVYAMRLRWQLCGPMAAPATAEASTLRFGSGVLRDSLSRSPASARGTLRFLSQGSSPGPARLRGISALTRTFSLSSADAARTLHRDGGALTPSASPAAMSPFGARSPHWKPEDD